MKHLVFVERFIISGQKAVDKRGICLRARALISLRSLNQGRRVSKVDGRSPRERFERINVPGGAGADSLVVVCRVTRVNQQRHARNRTSSSPLRPPPLTLALVRPRRLCQLWDELYRIYDARPTPRLAHSSFLVQLATAGKQGKSV